MTGDCQDYEIVTSQHLAGPARVYKSADNSHCVILPEKLGIELDATMEFKKMIGMDLKTDALPFYCIMPEQIFEAIERLPHPDLVKEVILKENLVEEISDESSELNSPGAYEFDADTLILTTPFTLIQLQTILLEHSSSFQCED